MSSGAHQPINDLQRFIKAQKALFSSTRLKEVLDAAIVQFSELSGGAHVAILLSDNDGMSFKLMACRGYSESTAEQLRNVPFTAESLLKDIVQKRLPVLAAEIDKAPDVSHAIMLREGSQVEIALPLISTNLLVGAVLIDSKNPQFVQAAEILNLLAELVALAVSNAILFGRSEFERERLSTLYKATMDLSSSVLKVAEVLQIAADTALFVTNTHSCAVLMVDPTNQAFGLAAYKGLDSNSLDNFDLSLTTSMAGHCLKRGKTEYVSEATADAHGMPKSNDGAPFASILVLPMYMQDDQLGVLMLFSPERRAFHREQVELLESLMKQVTTALHIAITHESTASQSIQDAATGLYNRWHFEDALAKEIERSQRHKRNLAVLLLDVDHLSHINEYFGQEKGDEAIKYVARIIKDALRDIDIPCRFGGEEFGIILPETPRDKAYEVAERLRQTVRSESAPGIGMLTVSVGMASFPDNADDAGTLIKAMEQALDIAKFEGRDRVKIAEIGQPIQGPISWEDLAKQARLSLVSEKQSRMGNKLAITPEYAAWNRPTLGWTQKKKPGDK